MRSPAAVILALAVACGGKSKAPPSVPSIAMPSGANLLPYSASAPASMARPTAMDRVNGRVYIALGNYDVSYVARGPGLLAALDPTTGSTQVIDIGGSNGTQCQEPGFVHDSGGKIYVSCSGYTDLSAASPATTGTAIVEVDPGTGKLTRIVSVPTSPQGLAVTQSRVWFGDAVTGAVYAVDLTSFAIVAGPVTIPCPSTGYQTTNDVRLIQGDLYAACSNNTGGILSRLDANTGNLKMQVDSGPIAVAFTETYDGRIAILSGADSKLRLVTIGSSRLTMTEAYTYQGTDTMQDIRSSGQYLFTTSSGTDTVQKLDLTRPQAQMLVGEASMGTGAVPWSILPLDDDQALVSNQTANTVVSVSSDCSSGRVCWAVPK